MTMVREIAPIERFTFLAGLPLDPEDLGRLDVAQGRIVEPGIFVEANTGESRFLDANQPPPDGVWIAQEELDQLKPGGGEVDRETGYGEGWGTQGPQLGGDRGYAEEEAGGTRRVAHDSPDATSQDNELPPG